MVCCTNPHDLISSKNDPRGAPATPWPSAPKWPSSSVRVTMGSVLCLLLDFWHADQDVFLSSKFTRLQMCRGMSRALGCRRDEPSSPSSPKQKRRNTHTSRVASHLGQRIAPFPWQVWHRIRRPSLGSPMWPSLSHWSQRIIKPVLAQALQSA